MGREKLFSAPGSVLTKTTVVKSQANVVLHPDYALIKTSMDKSG